MGSGSCPSLDSHELEDLTIRRSPSRMRGFVGKLPPRVAPHPISSSGASNYGLVSVPFLGIGPGPRAWRSGRTSPHSLKTFIMISQ